MDEAIQQVSHAIFTKSLQESQEVYTQWSETYDKDMDALICPTSSETAKMLQKYAVDSKTLLDLGGGTAIVVQLLRKAGYEGVVDILDANLQMLVTGEKKQVNLRNIICHRLNEDGILPLKDEAYEAVTCAGSFIPNHIPANALKGVLKVVKRGGIFVVTTRSSSTESYKLQFDEAMNCLKNEKKIEVLEEKEFTHFENLKDSDVKSIVYVFKRL